MLPRKGVQGARGEKARGRLAPQNLGAQTPGPVLPCPLDCPQERFKKLKKEYGSKVLGEVTVEQALGGMRGIPVGPPLLCVRWLGAAGWGRQLSGQRKRQETADQGFGSRPAGGVRL